MTAAIDDFYFNNLPPLALYVHIPWCVRKCPYCDFNSHAQKGELPEAQYIDALLKDLQQDLPLVWGRRLSSVFIGGGTPSLFSPRSLDDLLSGIRALMPLAPEAEITLEANPGTVEQDKFAEYRTLGINRISIGIQSFDNSALNKLGRIHNAKEAFRAVETAQRAEFENINLDLMFGLPDQTLAMAGKDVREAIALQPTHISYYQLTIEPNTLFHARPPELPDDERIWEYQVQGQDLLAESGYAQYEVSAYAQENKQCRHNLNYWQFGDYLGIGAGAHAKISDANRQTITRYAKLRHPTEYMDKAEQPARLALANTLTKKDVVLEFMMNAMRLLQGVKETVFEQHTGLAFDQIDEQLNLAQERGLLQKVQGYIQPTKHGQRYLNDLLEMFLPA